MSRRTRMIGGIYLDTIKAFPMCWELFDMYYKDLSKEN
jgi:hypothetical protein